MKEFKSRWEITKNWQLLYPFIGLIVLGYSAFKISNAIVSQYGYFILAIVAIVLFFILFQFTMFLFRKLEKKWILNAKWEMIRVFIVFAITGSSSLFVGRPIINWLVLQKKIFTQFLIGFCLLLLDLSFTKYYLCFLVGFLDNTNFSGILKRKC